MKTLRVLHVMPAVATRYGGPTVALFDLCRALRVRGVETLVATTNGDGPGHLPVELGRIQVYNDVPVVFFSRQVSTSFNLSLGLARWLRTNVRSFDVVHIHAVFGHSSIAAARACRRHGVPYLLRPLGTLDPWSLAQKRFRKNLFLRLFGSSLFRGAAAIAYTTTGEMQLAERALGLGNGIVVSLGVPEDAFDQRVPPSGGGPYILSLSRLAPKKGLDLLVRAFGELCRDARFAEWRLVMAGDGDPTFAAHLKSLAAAECVEGRVTFTGWVDGASKAGLLGSASLFALPSHQENFGIAIVEAMARGVPPLVSTGVNLAADIDAAGAGWVVEPRVGAIRDTLARAMSDAPGRLRRALAARRFAERFRWSVVVEDVIANYHAAIDAATTSAGGSSGR